MKYYQHKEKPSVICRVTNNTASFSKWKWQGNTCSEENRIKVIDNSFYNSFIEINEKEYNKIWGNNLQKA